jgi:hypothetical protein
VAGKNIPGPGHSSRDRSLAVRLDPAAPPLRMNPTQVRAPGPKMKSCALLPLVPSGKGRKTHAAHSSNESSVNHASSICPTILSAVFVDICRSSIDGGDAARSWKSQSEGPW